jgi:hypothetical protein
VIFPLNSASLFIFSAVKLFAQIIGRTQSNFPAFVYIALLRAKR